MRAWEMYHNYQMCQTEQLVDGGGITCLPCLVTTVMKDLPKSYVQCRNHENRELEKERRMIKKVVMMFITFMKLILQVYEIDASFFSKKLLYPQ